MMSFMQRFLEAIKGRFYQRPREDDDGIRSPFPDKDLAIPLVDQVLRKWGDVEFYGPGKEEAEARRRQRLGLEAPEETKTKVRGKDRQPRKKRGTQPGGESAKIPRLIQALLKSRDKFKREVNDLEK